MSSVFMYNDKVFDALKKNYTCSRRSLVRFQQPADLHVNNVFFLFVPKFSIVILSFFFGFCCEENRKFTVFFCKSRRSLRIFSKKMLNLKIFSKVGKWKDIPKYFWNFWHLLIFLKTKKNWKIWINLIRKLLEEIPMHAEFHHEKLYRQIL